MTKQQFLQSLINGGFDLDPATKLPAATPPSEYHALQPGGMIKYSTVKTDPETKQTHRVYRSGGILIQNNFPRYLVLKNPNVRYDSATGRYAMPGCTAASGASSRLRPTWTVSLSDKDLALFYRKPLGGAEALTMLRIKNALDVGDIIAKPADQETKDAAKIKEQARQIKLLKAQLAAKK